jgi:hypothetical protein
VRIFLFTTASRLNLEPTQPPAQWLQGDISLGIKKPGREAYLPIPSSAEFKGMPGAIPPFPQYSFMAWRAVKSTETALPIVYTRTSLFGSPISMTMFY